MESDYISQQVSRLCHDAGISAVLAAMQRYCQNRAYLDTAEGIAQIIRGLRRFDLEHDGS